MLKKILKLLPIVALTAICTAAAMPVSAGAPAADIDAYVIKFDMAPKMSANKTGLFVSGDGYGQGTYSLITKDDPDAPFIRLRYEERKSNYSPYRCMPMFLEGNYPTAAHEFVRVTFRTTDNAAAKLRFRVSSKFAVVVPNTRISNGEWVTSAPMSIKGDLLDNISSSGRAFLEYTALWGGGNVDIKEIAFFKSEADAYAYYGDAPIEGGLEKGVPAITYGAGGTGTFAQGSNYGKYTINTSENAVDIIYAESTSFTDVHYMAKVKYDDPSSYDTNCVYMRILYSAKNPEGCENVKLYIRNDASGGPITLVENLVNTDGYVFTETIKMPETFPARLAKGGHFSLFTDAKAEGGVYSVKGLYFFPTKEEGDSFVPKGGDYKITINGNDISKYQIVIPDHVDETVYKAAGGLVAYVKALSDVSLPIVTDKSPVSEYEILVGRSSRELSGKFMDELVASGETNSVYCTDIVGNTLIISSELPANLEAAVETFILSCLYKDMPAIPEVIEIGSKAHFSSRGIELYAHTPYDPAVNVSDPKSVTVNFDADEGYFTEENGGDDWKYEGGAYVTDTDDLALSYIHVYEANVNETATFKYTRAGANGDMALLARYVAEDAYLKAGYDFKNGEWYIDYREGTDFYRKRAASVMAQIAPNTEYTLNLLADGNTVTLSVNGQAVLTASVPHVTSGRIGMCAYDIALSVDNFDAVLMSGQGTVLLNVEHTRLPDEQYREGGSVMILNDGTWMYQNHRGATFKSLTNGKTWDREYNLWVDIYGYMNVLKLNNGSFLQVATKNVGGVDSFIARISADDGKTWTEGGVICPVTHPELNVGGGNMNDKLSQSGTNDRIFFGLNYDTRKNEPGKMRVFCEYYYSDDNGMTWTRSETGSYEIPGNESATSFGENKLLQCADGTVRMYCSWNLYGNIMYADSADGGKTFGELKELTGFVSTQSSLQFARDPYGPTPTSYYMVWVYCEQPEAQATVVRTRLCLAYTTDGKNWEYLGDIWRWECPYTKSQGSIAIAHIVDPFINVTEDYVVCGTGISEKKGTDYHNEQRQHIWSIRRDTLPEGKQMNVFKDIDLGNTYYNAVSYVSKNGLFNGTSENTFSPETSMTRSMFVTVLGRLDGIDTAKYVTPTFRDVVRDQWYTAYVEWAAANSIVNGIGDGLYGINENVTVEQALTILARYNGFKQGNPTGKTTASFSDGAEVSSWAAEGVKWAVENGIYTGRNGKLCATAPATRAVVAEMFYNYVSVFSK